jgi:hypothetical protein
MNTTIKIIKHNRDAKSEVSPVIESSNVQSAESVTREVVSTVKSWIAEFKDRKRTEHLSFAGLPAVATSIGQR